MVFCFYCFIYSFFLLHNVFRTNYSAIFSVKTYLDSLDQFVESCFHQLCHTVILYYWSMIDWLIDWLYYIKFIYFFLTILKSGTILGIKVCWWHLVNYILIELIIYSTKLYNFIFTSFTFTLQQHMADQESHNQDQGINFTKVVGHQLVHKFFLCPVSSVTQKWLCWSKHWS